MVACRRVDDAHPRLTDAALSPVDTQAIDSVRYALDLNGTDAEDLEDGLEDLVAAGVESS